MPTPSARLGSSVTQATEADIAGIYALDPTVFRVANAEALKAALWNNPWFGPESLFVMRNRDGTPAGGRHLHQERRLRRPARRRFLHAVLSPGRFGTEGMTTKRIKGLFSFVTSRDRNIFTTGMDLLSYASHLLRDDDDIGCYAAQVASDATALHSFYQRNFERQGSFPVYERDLTK